MRGGVLERAPSLAGRERAERALAALQGTGYLEATAYAMNLSGRTAYHPRRLAEGLGSPG